MLGDKIDKIATLGTKKEWINHCRSSMQDLDNTMFVTDDMTDNELTEYFSNGQKDILVSEITSVLMGIEALAITFGIDGCVACEFSKLVNYLERTRKEKSQNDD